MSEEEKIYPRCYEDCKSSGENCTNNECRMWVNYEKDYNCSLVSIEENGPMTLDEVSKRLGISLVRVSQIEKKALNKILKRIKI